MSYSKLCNKIKHRKYWDKILFSPVPRAEILHEGYRINITQEKEEDIKKAKEILNNAKIIFNDRKATSFSEFVQPGDRTLRVTHPASVAALRQMWAEEFRKSRLAQSLREKEGGK